MTRQCGGDTVESLIDSCNHGAVIGICLPGDTIVLKTGTQHAVLTVYPEGTSIDRQVALVAGVTFIQKSDLGETIRLGHYRNGSQRMVGGFSTMIYERVFPAYTSLFPILQDRTGTEYEKLKALAMEIGQYNEVRSIASKSVRKHRGDHLRKKK